MGKQPIDSSRQDLKMFSLYIFLLRYLTFYVAFPSKQRWNKEEEEQRETLISGEAKYCTML